MVLEQKGLLARNVVPVVGRKGSMRLAALARTGHPLDGVAAMSAWCSGPGEQLDAPVEHVRGGVLRDDRHPPSLDVAEPEAWGQLADLVGSQGRRCCQDRSARPVQGLQAAHSIRVGGHTLNPGFVVGR